MPLVLAGLVSGTIVDRFGRRRTAVVSDVLSGVSVAAIPVAGELGLLSLGLLVALAALGSVFDPAGVTARETMLPDAADAARLRRERVNGIHEAVFGVAFLVGPALGGLLIAWVGAETTLWATAIAFAVSSVATFLVGLPSPAQPAEGERRPMWRDGVEGILFVWNDRMLRALTILFAVLVGAWVPIEGVLLPVYFQAQDAPERLGIILMAMSVGGIVGALAYGAIGHRVRRRDAVIVGLVGTALPVVGMAFLPPFWLLVLLGAATGLAYGPINPIANIALQETAPPHLLGRAIGVLISLAYASGPLGFLVVGPLIEWIGLRATFLALAIVLVAVALVAPFVRALEALDAPGGSACAGTRRRVALGGANDPGRLAMRILLPMAETPHLVEDLQASSPDIGLALSHAGVRGVQKAVRIRRGDAETVMAAVIDCTVDLAADQKGVHMSRFPELFEEAIDIVVGQEALLVEVLADHIASRVVERQAALRAEVWIRAQWPIRRRTPVTGLSTQEMVTLCGIAMASETGTRRVVGVEATGINACPCAQGLVRNRASERLLEAGFDSADVERILQLVPIATHNQRGRATLFVGTEGDLDAEVLVGIAEASMSAPIYDLLKRPDELFVVEHAHLQPRFVEDSVRHSLRDALDALPQLDDDDFLLAKQVNFETIHVHDVVAERYGTVGELRGELATGTTSPQQTTLAGWLAG